MNFYLKSGNTAIVIFRMFELVFDRKQDCNSVVLFVLEVKTWCDFSWGIGDFHTSISRTYRGQTQEQTVNPTFLGRSSLISKGGPRQNRLRRGTMEVDCSSTTLLLLTLRCLFTNFLPTIKWVLFYTSANPRSTTPVNFSSWHSG